MYEYKPHPLVQMALMGWITVLGRVWVARAILSALGGIMLLLLWTTWVALTGTGA